MGANKAYTVRIYRHTDHQLLQPNYRIVVKDSATGFGFGGADPVKIITAATAESCVAQYVLEAGALDITTGCDFPDVRTSLLADDGTPATLFPSFDFAYTAANILLIGGIDIEFTDNKHVIKILPYGTDQLTFNYIYDGVNRGYGTLLRSFNTDRVAITIPWWFPDMDTPGMYLYTMAFDKPNQYRIIFPVLGSGNRFPQSFSALCASYGTNLTNVAQFFQELYPIDIDDPYSDIDDSVPSGPAEGVGIPDSDPVDIPSLPSVSVVDTGFVTLFNPTLAQVKNLASYMWAGLFDVATFKKIFADPMDCILGFNMLPVAIPNGGTGEVVVGNISTGVSMTKAAGQWVEVSCGEVNVDKPYGNYLDYSPYTKISLYLPYIGTVELSADDVMGKTLRLVYHIDVLSCACVAYLKCGASVLYQFTGSCGYSIPVNGDNFRQMISNIVGIAATVGAAVVTGGAAAPAATAGMTAKQAARAAAKAAAMKQASQAAAIGAGESVAKSVMASKPEVHRTGAIGSSAGMMGLQKPYLIMEIPKACKPAKQYHYLGYPAFVTVQLGEVSGYQEFESVILDGIPCTEEERQLLDDLCKGGIYL